MVRFLSAAWLDTLATAAAAAAPPGVADTIVVQVVVRGVAEVGDPVTWHLVATPERLAIVPGGDDRAIVTLSTDVETAAALARGDANAQLALDRGALRVRGDLADLARARGALDALGDVFAAVRADTDFDVARPAPT